jgi:hypothetical protein
MVEIAKIPEEILRYKNVNGYSTTLQPKEKDGVFDYDQEVIRIYVEKKEPLDNLYSSHVLPQSVDDIPIDVYEIGRVEAYVPAIPNDGRRDQVRPMMSGISIGHVAITAGTLGHLAKYTDGEIYATSNAHVLTPDPSHESSRFTDLRILQPGKYDDNIIANNVVGNYFWHERIFPSDLTSKCPVTRAAVWGFNKIASAGGFRSRVKSYVSGVNYQDFAAFKINDGIGYDETKTWDFDINDYTLCGRLFAGSTTATIICKTSYQVQSGFTPEVPYIDQPPYAKHVRKSGRTTGDTDGLVFDTSGVINVNYGNFTAAISDAVITTDMSAGGDSGSDIWIKTEDI